MDDDGIRYGLTTHALIARTIATAPTMGTIQSTAIRARRGRRPVTRSSGWWYSCPSVSEPAPAGGEGGQENGGAGGGGERYSSGTAHSSAARPSPDSCTSVKV